MIAHGRPIAGELGRLGAWTGLLALAAAASLPAPPARSQEPGEPGATIVLAIEDGQASQARLTRILEDGAADAARDEGVALEVVRLRGTIADRIGLLASIVGTHPAGMVVASEEPAAFGEPIRAAVSAGIPVVLTWSGLDAWQGVGAATFVGVDDEASGELAGQRLVDLGATNGLCVIDDVNVRRLDERCAGATAAFEAASGHMDLLRALDPPGDPTGVRDAIAARLMHDGSIDAVLATEDDGIRWALQAVRRIGDPERVRLAAFDPEPEVIRALAEGDLAFAVDTGPYAQGYLPVQVLAQAAHDGVAPAEGEPIRTGPELVTPGAAAERLEADPR
jgi:simple sugar transport system substrate-binding protein